MREIVRASAWGGFRELVRELGGDPDEILAAAHVDTPALSNPDRYMPLRAYIDTLEIAAERLGRPDFGLTMGAPQQMAEQIGDAIGEHQFGDRVGIGARDLG